MISEAMAKELTAKAVAITGAEGEIRKVSVSFIHTPKANTIKYTIVNRDYYLKVSDWCAEMDEYMFTAMMVFFIESTVLCQKSEMPEALKDWVDDNRHRWAPEASA